MDQIMENESKKVTKVRTSISIDPGLLAQLKSFAENDKSDVSKVVTEACIRFLKESNGSV